jgi:hypothetical protein
MSVILYVNSREPACGVGQWGKRTMQVGMKSTQYQSYYIDIDRVEELHHWINELAPAAIVYNYYPGTMGWLSASVINSYRHRCKQLGMFHEVPIDSLGFDLMLHQDPTNEDTRYVNLTRQIPDYGRKAPYLPGDIIISSFGFGLGGKGFTRLVEIAAQQCPGCTVRLNIPFAAFGDSTGQGARQWADACRQLLSADATTKLVITHELWPEEQLVQWLGESTINCFFYDQNYGRGISGTLDYSLAARRPIAITKSWQFKHVWSVDDSFLIENKTLPEIIAMGTQHLDKFHVMWSEENLIRCFEEAFRRVDVY